MTGHGRSFHDIDGIEDLVVATFELADGGVGSLTTVWHDLTERPSLRYLEIHCERMHVAVEGDWLGPVRITRAGERIDVAGDELLALCAARGVTPPDPARSFVDAVAAGRPASPSADTAIRAHRIVDAIYASAGDDGRRTEVE